MRVINFKYRIIDERWNVGFTSAYGAQASMAFTKLTTSSTVQRETTRLWCSSLAQADEQRGERDRGRLLIRPNERPNNDGSLPRGLVGDDEGDPGDTGDRERFTGGPDNDRSSGSPTKCQKCKSHMLELRM